MTAPSQPSPIQGPQVVERRDAAGGEHGNPGSKHLLDEDEVRAGERAVARCARDEQTRHADLRAATRKLPGREFRHLRPALDRNAPVADVDRDDECGCRSARPPPRETPCPRAAVPTITRSAPASRAVAIASSVR